MLVNALPELSYRKHLQTAELMAAILNALGGKPDPAKKDESKPIDPSRLFTGEELLVHFARRAMPNTWTLEAAKAVTEAKDRMPSWARDSLPWELINRALSA